MLAKRMGNTAQKGVKMLKPIALVGKWSGSDLPRFGEDGTWLLPYNAKRVVEGELSEFPQASLIFESPEYLKKDSVDPRNLPPIDLTAPKPTKEQQEQFRAWKALFAAKKALDDSVLPDFYKGSPTVWALEAKNRLAMAKSIIDKALA
jgi:hypothetical protein